MPMSFAPNAAPNVSSSPMGEEMDLVATHQRLLIGAALRTQGPILELGVGWYSTPLLHEIAESQLRQVCTLDNNSDWLNQFLNLRSKHHRFELVGWWGEAYEKLKSQKWGMCFVDHGQPIEREYAIRALLDSVGVFVLHDTEEGFAYGYDRILGMFKYQWTDNCQKTWTTVCSNYIDVSSWFRKLPPVEPTIEVT